MIYFLVFLLLSENKFSSLNGITFSWNLLPVEGAPVDARAVLNIINFAKSSYETTPDIYALEKQVCFLKHVCVMRVCVCVCVCVMCVCYVCVCVCVVCFPFFFSILFSFLAHPSLLPRANTATTLLLRASILALRA